MPTGASQAARLVPAPSPRVPCRCPGPKPSSSGETLTDDVSHAAAHAVYEIAKPMDNTDFELVWRKKMMTSLATCALRELRGDDVRAERQRLAKAIL